MAGWRDDLLGYHFKSQRDCHECYWSGGCNHSLPAAWVVLVQKVPQTPPHRAVFVLATSHTGHWVSVLATSTEIPDVLMASPGEGGTFRKGLAHTWGLLSTQGWAEPCSCLLLNSPVHWVLSCVAQRNKSGPSSSEATKSTKPLQRSSVSGSKATWVLFL